jgi:TnpA family transposase
MKQVALESAKTKEDLADIINRMLEELIKNQFELPGYRALLRMARAARTVVHHGHYQRINQALSEVQKQRIDKILAPKVDASDEGWTWHDLKQEPQSPTPKRMAIFFSYVSRLIELKDQFSVDLRFILPERLEHLRDEAMVTDQSDMQKIGITKRYSLFIILVHMKLSTAIDDLVHVLTVWIRNIESSAKTKLQAYQLAHADQKDYFVLLFYEMLLTLEKNNSDREKIEEIEKQLDGKQAKLIDACREHLGLIGDKYFGWMIKPYRDKRCPLFNLLENLTIRSSSKDKSLENALRFIKHHRSSHKEWLTVSENDEVPVDLSLLSETWFKLVTGRKKGEPCDRIHRHYYELAVFYILAGDLNCCDAYVEGAYVYDDPNKQFISWGKFHEKVESFCEQAALPKEPEALEKRLKEKVRNAAAKVNKHYSSNPHLVIHEGKPIIKKLVAKMAHPQLESIRQAIAAEMPVASIIDIIVDVERWLQLSSGFKPLSGKESKIANYPSRFIATAFSYGCNLGPTQTERCLLPFTRKQIAWLFHHHATEQRLIKTNKKIINEYNLFELPKNWGPGDSASVDGTFLDMYTQNLLAAHHIRYGRYGGVGYYHVSDKYIALFSNFISSAVHESVYLLDGVATNDSDMKIDKIHGDSWAQSEVLFGLSHLMGIAIMPRIKRFKHLNYYKADPDDYYENIQELFTEKPIDWELIKTHYYDMLRVILSIQEGKIKASTILKKLCSKSRKNKLYFAFRELGRVIRTEFLLNYIDDAELRRTIQAATCKSEEFNEFSGWVRFGGGGVIADNLRFSQRKIVKFNHLLSNMVIFHTVVHQTKAVNKLRSQGMDIPPEILARLSPYWRDHINRFGVFTLNMDKMCEEIDYALL